MSGHIETTMIWVNSLMLDLVVSFDRIDVQKPLTSAD